MLDLRGGFFIAFAAALALLAPAASAAGAGGPLTDVVVVLEAPPLAQAVAESRALSQTARRARLNLRSATSVFYLRSLATAQRHAAARIERALPESHVRWRYGVVVNGLAVSVREGSESRLAALPGVAGVYPSVRYHSLLDRSTDLIGAPLLWGPDFSTAGGGLKIGVIDDGVDQRHPFFSARGFTMPAGFPKGQAAFTTAKVIVARAFPPRSPKWQHAAKPFDPLYSGHATHVAGIAAGDRGTSSGGRTLAGTAPAAYIGNYKVLTIPTASNVGLDGNSAEIVAGIEAAVRDGMDVINLSLGEPEIEPTRDIVVRAINAAADAGVVPAIAAGNDFDEFGKGTVGSPGSAPKAITAAAVTKARRIASFSSSGPTPVSLQLKPDVSAPGANILSSIPAPDLWSSYSGTSMAAPHIAGAAALLRQRNPGWTVQQIKAALVLTADPVPAETGSGEVPVTRQGGGLANLRRAVNPLLFASPTAFAFGEIARGASSARTVALTDAGGGGGSWSVSVQRQSSEASATVTAPASVSVPGSLELRASVPASGAEGDVGGFVVLRNAGGESRRIPFWFRADTPALTGARRQTLTKQGTYNGNTRGRAALVDTYRYPESPAIAAITTSLPGPEHVFRYRLTRAVHNFGVAILSTGGSSVEIEPRIVYAGNENRLTGYAALPINLNPYLASFLRPAPTAAALLPAPGTYDIVFDTQSRAEAGRFRFRFWVDDRTSPTIKLVPRSTSRSSVTVAVSDAGSGVDPDLLSATIDGTTVAVTYQRAKGRAILSPSRALTRGKHGLVVRASDYQETKNNENVVRILPNTRTFRTTFTVR